MGVPRWEGAESLLTGHIQDLTPQPGEVVQYHLTLGSETVHLNPYVGKPVRIEPTGEKACVWCGRPVKKLFPNGSCYPCFKDLPQNDLCIVKPYLCHYDTCRDPSWGDAHCMVPTYLYIARSSEIKVGISRNIPGRWLEQGAVEAVVLARLPNRKVAGELELLLSRHIADRTNWRRMLRGEVSPTPLAEVRQQVLALVPDEYRPYLLPDAEPARIAYPMTGVPDPLTSIDLDRGPAAGVLLGMKAKYLVLSTGALNVPKYAGYGVRLALADEAVA